MANAADRSADGFPELFRYSERFEPTRRVAHSRAVGTWEAWDPVRGGLVLLRAADAGAPPAVAEGLVAEAAAMSLVPPHRHVQRLFERIGADAAPVLVLEWRARNLADAVAGGPLPAPLAVATTVRLATGLRAVDAAGLVHCGVTPGAVLLDEAGEPLLGGFGAAFRRGAASVRALPDVTQFTAPELLLGELPTPATDVYGLAGCLYAMLTGHAPHRAFDGESQASLSARLLSSAVRPIIAPEVPLPLSDLLLWALRRDPAERPPATDFLVEELAHIERAHGWPRTRTDMRPAGGEGGPGGGGPGDGGPDLPVAG